MFTVSALTEAGKSQSGQFSTPKFTNKMGNARRAIKQKERSLVSVGVNSLKFCVCSLHEPKKLEEFICSSTRIGCRVCSSNCRSLYDSAVCLEEMILQL